MTGAITHLPPDRAVRFSPIGRRPGLPVGPQSAARNLFRRPFLRMALLTMAFLPAARTALAQALPAAEAAPISTGFALPSAQGTLRYSLSASESFSHGYYGDGTEAATGANGSLAFISPSQLYPFSMVVSAGDSWATNGGPSTYFLNLGLSQVINTRNWNFVLSDTVSYLPQTPSVGLSGIPGTGDVGVPPIQVGTDTGQAILTQYSSRVANAASAGAGLHLTGKTTLQFSGTYSDLYFLGNSTGEFNSTTESGTVGLSHRIDARNSTGASYAYSQFGYGAGQPTGNSQSATLQYSHQFTRKLGMSLSAGPQWSGYTNVNPPVPSSINLSVSASASYAAQFTAYSLSYSRGTNSGSGIIQGAESDSVSFRVSRTFGGVWNTAASASYTRSTALQSNISTSAFAPQTVVGSMQLSRAIARSLSTYASYTLEDQTTVGTAAGADVFSGLFQTAAFGLTFSPSPIHLGSR